MELTQEQIDEINKKSPYGQGVFREPFGIPNNIKELVVYTKYKTASKGGNYLGDKHEREEHQRPRDCYKVLDFVLKVLKPNITFLEYKEIEELIDSISKTDYGYYGDYTEESIEWIVLSDLYKKLEEFE